jgi:hypothetical protein
MLAPQYLPEPLDTEERAHVRRLQVALKALKTCASCGLTQLAYRFPRYGATLCEACLAEPYEFKAGTGVA